MDVPKSDLGDVIAWSLRGGRVGGRGGGELRKATVMMKHFLFNESGGNHGRNDFYAFFFFLKKRVSLCNKVLGGLDWPRRMQAPPTYKPLVLIL